MASKPGRKLNNWKQSYATRLARCVATQLYRDGHNRAELLRRFKGHLPDYQSYFEHPVSDTSIWMRGYLGSKPGYESEHPDNDPQNMAPWAEATRIIEDKLSLEVFE